MEETTWVRSVYLYVVCGIALVLFLGGAVSGVLAIGNVVSPDLGHRDAIDRIGIGASNIAADIISLVEEAVTEDNEEFCESVTFDEEAFEECLEDVGGDEMATDMLTEGVADIRSELESQIRDSAIAQLIKAALVMAVGVVLWRIHAPRTLLYASMTRDAGDDAAGDATDHPTEVDQPEPPEPATSALPPPTG